MNLKAECANGMCMLAKTVAELTDEHAELLGETKKSLKIMEGASSPTLIAPKRKI